MSSEFRLALPFNHLVQLHSFQTKAYRPYPCHRYVEDGRNPDIYTREFVEIVAKQNQFMNGKMRAFGEFRDVLAEQISSAFPELSEDVEMVLGKSAGRRRRRRRGEEKAVNGP